MAASPLADTAPAADIARIIVTKVFVRGLKVDAQIGVYDHEHGRLQPLVVDVELDVAASHCERLGDTVNYETIGEAARAIVAWRDGEPWLPARGPMRSLTRGYLGLVGVVHLILSPPLFLVLAHQAGAADRATQSLVADIPHDNAIRQQDLVIVNLPDVLFQIYVRPTLATLNALKREAKTQRQHAPIPAMHADTSEAQR